MKLNISSLSDANLNNAHVFLRSDLNVSLNSGQIVDDFRLQQSLQSIDHLLNNNNIVLVATHIGRPKDNDPKLSTKILIPWFEQHGYTVTFIADIDYNRETLSFKKKHFYLFENLRFFPGELRQDVDFAKKLSLFADYYVNDAFSVCHRNDTSVTILAQQFLLQNRFAGFITERECTQLDMLKKNYTKSLTIILGGGKIEKMALIPHLFDIATHILLCPAISLPFLQKKGISTGAYTVNHDLADNSETIINHAKKMHVDLLFPLDYQIAIENLDGPLSIVDADSIPDNGICTSIGPKTIQLYSRKIQSTEATIFNGATGFFTRPETLTGMKSLFHCMETIYSVVAGGDSIAAVRMFDMEDKFNILSSAGGAALQYLGNMAMPGLDALIKK